MNPVAASIKKWTLDTNHTHLGFSIGHLGMGSIKGFFNEYDGAVEVKGERFDRSRIKLVIDVASISTGNEMRDNHLKTPEFFDALTYQTITFESTHVKKTGEETFEIIGNLTIKETTKKITLEAVHRGTTQDMGGNVVAVFQVTGRLNRLAFGVEWCKVLDSGLPVISKEVEFDMNIELIPQESELLGN